MEPEREQLYDIPVPAASLKGRPSSAAKGPADTEAVLPKYQVMVKRTFDWTKYNQAHYSSDNPPPKYVQGYTFKLFYPNTDIIPSFQLYDCEPEADSVESYQYIIFSVKESKKTVKLNAAFQNYPGMVMSPSPNENTSISYRDICFKIVKKEWETNHKFGFKCLFEEGIFRLEFSFKKLRYKR